MDLHLHEGEIDNNQNVLTINESSIWTWLQINNLELCVGWISKIYYRSGTVNSNTVNSKFHLIRSYYEIFFYHFPNIPCLKCTVNSNFHLIRSKTLPTNDFELTVPDLYYQYRARWTNMQQCMTAPLGSWVKLKRVFYLIHLACG